MRKIVNAFKKLKSKNWAVLTLNVMALVMVVQNMNAGCFWIEHQPEVPEEARRFRKF